jgi:hypothetical protein
MLACAAAPAFAEQRVALVIGNGAYRNAVALPNPRNDAQDVAVALRRLGFNVIAGVDLDRAGMDEHLIRFARAAREADVALFYYSGHAMQFAGVNYLMPVDARLSDEADLRRMMRVDDVIDDLQQARNLRILVLDSCRNNPLAEELKRAARLTRAGMVQQGLAKIDSARGMIVAYATQAGRTADDGSGRNSPYTTAFLKHIETQDEIGTIFRRIAADVYRATGSTQLPELSLSLVGEFYLRGKPPEAGPGAAAASGPCAEAEGHWRSAEQIMSKAAFEDHLARFPDCAYASLAKARIAALSQPESREQPLVAALVVEAGVAGRWETFVPNPRGMARWIWEISPNGTYSFRSEGRGAAPRHEGTITASGGRWTLRSLRGLPGYEDGGSYELRDDKTIVMTGRLGTGIWRRVQESRGPTRDPREGKATGGAPGGGQPDLPLRR